MTFGVLKYKRQISAPLFLHLYKTDPTNVRTDENTVPASIKWSLIKKTVQNLKKKEIKHNVPEHIKIN